jgi:hypothetical protein
MSTEKLIGARVTRITTVALGILAVLGLTISWSGSGGGLSWVRTLAIVCAVLALLGGIHCTRAGYNLWMRFAKILSGVMTTIVFGLCYLLLVPLFVPIVWLLDPLRLRRGTESQSFWHHRQSAPVDEEMLRRMG